MPRVQTIGAPKIKITANVPPPNQSFLPLREPEVILSLDELNLDQAPQDINKEEFQLQRLRLQASVAAADPGCKKNSLGPALSNLLKYIIESKPEDGLPNIVILLRIFFQHLPSVVPSGAHKGGPGGPDPPIAFDLFPIDYNSMFIIRKI
ncbi:uncharacterized protein TNCV_1664981 [Trichonephila clavipes]|uniref:Uncharacterized protein n=1 Tax=Trichonephila clavipes TaxID=2585209 RepID=A0A8X6VAJ9_TRICX|nr:uncharacterized protein TNCV_1664981 [Trichonephila clavipes]